jgi:hypothetical protein
MAGVQEIDPDLEILLILDSPQLNGLAPELVIYRDRVQVEAARIEKASCSSCTQRKVYRALKKIAMELAKTVFKSPELQKVMDALQASAAQALSQKEEVTV